MMTRPLSTIGSSGVDSKEDVERFIDLGRLSASLIHEISNPLTAALIHLEQHDNQPVSVHMLKRCLVDLSRYVDAARQQLRGESDSQYFYIDAQMRVVKRLVLPLARSLNVKLLFAVLPHLKITGNPVKFQQIVVNLIVNAVEAYKDSTSDVQNIVKVDIIQYSRSVTLKVTDWGEGIKPAQLNKVFRPFYSTKSHGSSGLGLGLAIVKRHIEEDFQGSIKVLSSKKNGTSFVVKFPL
jgi:signal transduction histidine kinase